MRKASLGACCLLFLLLAGCGLLGGGESGGPATVRLNLDEGEDFSVALHVGESLLLAVRHPGGGGYEFTGTHFDPRALRLDKFWTEKSESPEPGDFGRAYFVFTALSQGQTVVELKIYRPFEKGSAPEVYRTVKVDVAAGT